MVPATTPIASAASSARTNGGGPAVGVGNGEEFARTCASAVTGARDGAALCGGPFAHELTWFEGGAVTGASAASCAGAAMGATSNVVRLAEAAATRAVLSDRLGARVARVLGAAEADGAVDRADD